MMPLHNELRPLEYRKLWSSPTIRNRLRSFDHKPLPLLPYMVSVSTTIRSTGGLEKSPNQCEPVKSSLQKGCLENSVVLVEDYL